jgi:cyanophycinase-like exopeptidase
MARVHRRLLALLVEVPRPVFIDTPAGFELGLHSIHERFQDFFARKLDLPLEIASFRQCEEDPAVTASALSAIARGNYLLAGPGSPTYAVRHWRNTPVYSALVQRWLAGAQLLLSSSAAIAVGRHALPVYEIYKVGQDPHWTPGLDLVGPFGLELAVVPHWNNAEGGTHDTSTCFMGASRFARLKQLLPPTAVVLGIDEHTACVFDLDRGQVRIDGKGGVVIHRGEEVRAFRAGQTLALTELKPTAVTTMDTFATSGGAGESQQDSIAAAAAVIAAGDLAGGLAKASALCEPLIAALLLQAAQAASALQARPVAERPWTELVNLLLATRAALRNAGQWSLADGIREGLHNLGISIGDGPEGSTWRRRDT